MLGVDTLGFDAMDRQLLLSIIEKFDGGPVGIETLAAAIGEDAGTLEEVYEPYLLREGFIQRTPRGRVATPRAFAHLGLRPPGGGPASPGPPLGMGGGDGRRATRLCANRLADRVRRAPGAAVVRPPGAGGAP